LIRRPPDEVSSETIVAQLELKLLIAGRLADVERGHVMSHGDALKRLDKWLTSPGQSRSHKDESDFAEHRLWPTTWGHLDELLTGALIDERPR
jgi:hypothetical protein